MKNLWLYTFLVALFVMIYSCKKGEVCQNCFSAAHQMIPLDTVLCESDYNVRANYLDAIAEFINAGFDIVEYEDCE